MLIILVVLYLGCQLLEIFSDEGSCRRQLVDLVDVAAARQGVQKPVVRSRHGGAGSRWSFNEK